MVVIKKGEYTKTVLVDFDMLFDIDLACVLYLKDNYGKSKFFKEESIEYSFYYLRYLVLTTKNRNPISILFKDEYVDKVDGIYNELISTKLNEVLKYLIKPNDILKLLVADSLHDDVTITVNCKTEEEVKYIKSFEFTNDWNTVLNEIDASKYNTLFIHYVTDLSKLDNVSGKTIYLYNFGYNFEDDELKHHHPISMVLSEVNVIKYISPYADFEFAK